MGKKNSELIVHPILLTGHAYQYYWVDLGGLGIESTL